MKPFALKNKKDNREFTHFPVSLQSKYKFKLSI